MNSVTKVISINIDEDQVCIFTDKCKAMGYSRNKMLKKLIEAFNENRLSLDKGNADKMNDQLFNRSPAHASSIPAYASSTPAHASSTPAHASSTPAHTSSIPAHTSSIPAYASSTPAHASLASSSDTDDHKHNLELAVMLADAKHNAPQQSVGEAIARHED